MSKETLWHNFWKPGELSLKLNKIREKTGARFFYFIYCAIFCFCVSLFFNNDPAFPLALFTSLTLALSLWLCRVPEGQQRVAACYLNLMCQIKALYLAYCSSHPSAVCILTDHRSAPCTQNTRVSHVETWLREVSPFNFKAKRNQWCRFVTNPLQC